MYPETTPRRPDARESGARLLLAARLYRSKMAEALVPLGLHPGQDAILRTLGANGAMGAGALAALLDIKAPTLSKSISRLEKIGLVARSTDPANPKAVRVTLTETGAQKLGGLELALAELDDAVFAILDGKDRKRMRKSLKRIIEALAPSEGLVSDEDETDEV